MSLNLASILEMAAAREPERTAIICDEQSLTYRELCKRARKIAELLKEKGVKPSDSVLLMAPNVPEFTITYFGILLLGATVIPINTLLLDAEISYLLEHSDAKYFIAWYALAEKAKAAFRTVDSCEKLLFIGSDTEEFARSAISRFPDGEPIDMRISIIENELDRYPGELDSYPSSPGKTAVILYTSGTTGKPKGAELSHFNLFSNALYAWQDYIRLECTDVTLAVLPLFHSFGQTASQNVTIMAGGTLVMIPQFEPRKVLAQIEKHGVTYIASVPTMHHLLVQTQKRLYANTKSLRLAVSGGASLPVALFEEFKDTFGLQIHEGYGLSETSPIATFTPIEGPVKPGSIGPAIFGVDARIMRADGTFADVDEIGELVIRGHNVMIGYYKDHLATQAVLSNGWLLSGDMAKRDAEGYFYIVDRKKDVIIRAGMNIYPREVEELIQHHPEVKEVAVIGKPGLDSLNETVIAYVSKIEGSNVSAEEILKYCRDKLAPYKCPKIVNFLDQLPKGPTGKILKRTLRDM